MDISLLTLLIALALGTFALGFIFARLAKLAKLSTPAPQFATEGATDNAPAMPEPADVLTATQLHYQQTHINSLNTNLRLLEEKLRWAEQDRQDAEDAMADLQRQLKVAKEPRGDEVTQREAELTLLRAQLDAAINSASKLERKAIRAEHDAVAAKEENQQLRAKLWAQQSTDVALSRLQDRQTALQAAINENQIMRDRLAGEVVTLNAALAEREALLADRDAMLAFADRKLREKEEDYARLVARENAWEKQLALLADTQAQAAQAERERDDAQRTVAQLRAALDDAGAQIQLVSERLHTLHEAMALRDAQVTDLHSELRRLQQEHAAANAHRDTLREELAQTVAGAQTNEKELRAALARTVSVAEESRMILRLRDDAVTNLEAQLDRTEQQREMLEAALLLATASLTTLREEMNDAEAGRMLLEADLENKTQALALAQDDLAQLSSREYELTVALERTGREHQSSFETVLLHANKVEDDLAKAQAELAERNDSISRLAGQLREAEIALQAATRQASEKESERAALQVTLQERIDALAASEDALADVRSALKANADALAADESALTEMQSALQEKADALAAAQKHAGALADEISALTFMRNTLDAHLQAKVAVLATAEAVIASMHEQLAARDQELADLRILVHERGRALETAQSQITYLTDGLDDLNNTANEKFAALQSAQTDLNAAQTANEAAQARITQLTTERDALIDELAGAQKHLETLSSEHSALRVEWTNTLCGAAQLQSDLDEARAHIAQTDEINADLSENVKIQAGQIIALAKANDQFESALKLAEARVEDLALALENAGARHAAIEAQLQEGEYALEALRGEHAALLAAKAAGDEVVKSLTEEIIALKNANAALDDNLQFAQSRVEGQFHELKVAAAKHAGLEVKLQESADSLGALETIRRQHEAAIAQAETHIAALNHASEVATGVRLALETALHERESRLEHTAASLDELRQTYAALLQEHASALDALEHMRRQHEAAIAQAETHIAALHDASDVAAGERLALETSLHECEGRLEQATASLNELRQAHAALLQEHAVLRRAGDALEAQTRHQMETLVEISNASAMLQQQLHERDGDLLAAQVALAHAQQTLAAKPEPGTIEAQLIDTALTLQRLEREFAALQAEKDAIEDEYTREQIAGQLRMTEKELALRECGAHADALALEIALLKVKDE